ncbi:MAG: 50S ribosomal protein L21 [Candidatus Melainabacteria bacterium]|nr:50S ribosomal protein L21 [Candidatus Melainabacteria bacterium]
MAAPKTSDASSSNTRAIVSWKGKQYQVEEGRYLDMDRLPYAEAESFTLDQVQLILNAEGQPVVGAPFVTGALVKAKVLAHRKDRKQIVFKMRCKKGYRRKNGHRQLLSRVQIEAIEFPGK